MQNTVQLPSLSYLYGQPETTALLRVQPDDFIVHEELSFTPTGAGEHMLLLVEKIGQNTQYVAKLLAELAGCKARQVSYAGLKDRHAVTRQWFCLPVPIKQELNWQEWNIEGVKILDSIRHQRRLKLGSIKYNEFSLTLRDVSDIPALLKRLELVKQGVPNYYGEQRFGIQGGNLRLAEQLFSGGGIEDRKIRGLALSASRSFLFNLQVDARVKAGTFNQLLKGEVVQLDGSGSIFKVPEIDETLKQRLLDADIHPTAGLPGLGEPLIAAEALTFEQQSLTQWQHWVNKLAQLNVRAERRSIRVLPKDLKAEVQGQNVKISFKLYSGCFATSVLRELVDYQDVQRNYATLD
ncbi:tRNA pseudouridine(13) synthase TruD [Rheinheimera sediminis]|uniref:tRNA pseudouridine(13) synthase TruD n=1 Tax=Rheinheimera sp. YQF-1 TaxID=2499626 RepID=UPI000FDBA3BC|nr:tRNA pseudouridine(13) synthase TruD [Rheinheimera sp. YQF-1]RVT46070.1 tRNA pseudouridine(13) synthase TruD [Rheinheimera sp. YQF-1]